MQSLHDQEVFGELAALQEMGRTYEWLTSPANVGTVRGLPICQGRTGARPLSTVGVGASCEVVWNSGGAWRRWQNHSEADGGLRGGWAEQEVTEQGPTFIASMEFIVNNTKCPPQKRLGAWFKLWGSLRFSDAAHLKAENVRMFDGCMQGIMVVAKTTGAGKRVRELPFHISREAYVAIHDWLEDGFAVWEEVVKIEKGYMFPEGLFGGLGGGDNPLTYQEAVASSVDVLETLEFEDGEKLIPYSGARYWTEHPSERSTLASGLAELGVAKSDRDMLGRWQPEGSDQSIRTYSAAVSRMQRQFAETIRWGAAYEALEEGAIFEGVKEWLVEKWSVEKSKAVEAVEAWKDGARSKRADQCRWVGTGIHEEVESEPKKRRLMGGAERPGRVTTW